MSRPRLLDLFSGAGGCAKGYQRAGFHVTGVDIEPQPRYAGDEFIQADALVIARFLADAGLLASGVSGEDAYDRGFRAGVAHANALLGGGSGEAPAGLTPDEMEHWAKLIEDNWRDCPLCESTVTKLRSALRGPVGQNDEGNEGGYRPPDSAAGDSSAVVVAPESGEESDLGVCRFCGRPAAQIYAGVPVCAEPSKCRARLGPPHPPPERPPSYADEHGEFEGNFS